LGTEADRRHDITETKKRAECDASNNLRSKFKKISPNFPQRTRRERMTTATG